MPKKSLKKLNIFKSKIAYQFIGENKFIIGGVVVGLIFLIIGTLQLFSSPDSSTQIEIVPALSQDGSGSETQTSPTGQIIVDVAGSVNKPGVYGLPPDSRVAAAIEVAGNFSQKADLAWVSKNLNLAAKLQDGAKIYIPQKGEATTTSIQGAQSLTNPAKVNVNTASQSQLEALPAVGPVTASKIIGSRPYNSVEELLSKKVVGKSTFSKIKDLVSIF